MEILLKMEIEVLHNNFIIEIISGKPICCHPMNIFWT